MALLSNGVAEAWGFNSAGQLGIGSRVAESDVPVAVDLSGVLLLNAGPVSSLGFN
jgi:hypothetical protein